MKNLEQLLMKKNSMKNEKRHQNDGKKCELGENNKNIRENRGNAQN